MHQGSDGFGKKKPEAYASPDLTLGSIVGVAFGEACPLKHGPSSLTESLAFSWDDGSQSRGES